MDSVVTEVLSALSRLHTLYPPISVVGVRVGLAVEVSRQERVVERVGETDERPGCHEENGVNRESLGSE